MKALITGATSGIGAASARLFAKHGWNLVLTGRRQSRLDALRVELQELYSVDVITLCFDVRDWDASQEAWNSLDDDNVDLLLNNAGLARGFGPFQDGVVDDWHQMMDTNIKGLLYVSKLVSPSMIKRGEGMIINLCSIAGKEVYPGGTVYCASKAAVDALTKGMRYDLHKYGVRVGQICPGHVEETEFARVRFHGDEEKAKIYEDFQPLKSSDVAEVVYFMATRPPHVNIEDVVLWGTQQASATVIDRSGRKYNKNCPPS